MREIKHIVVHCTGTPHLGQTVADLRAHFRALGWSRPGYHFVVTADGNIAKMQAEHLVCNGVKGHNRHAIHVAYTGGVDGQGNPSDTRTQAQKTSLKTILTILKKRYPKAQICGHRDFPGVAKACPCFDAKEEYHLIKGV